MAGDITDAGASYSQGVSWVQLTLFCMIVLFLVKEPSPSLLLLLGDVIRKDVEAQWPF